MKASILFVCRHNACRSQIAEALARRASPASWILDSAGSHPSLAVDPKAVETLKRNGLAMCHLKPKGFSELDREAWDLVVDLSGERSGALVRAGRYLAWDFPDPLDGPMPLYEELFAGIAARVERLVYELDGGSHAR